jgi:F0F1-type ATP synthase assembly protein I
MFPQGDFRHVQRLIVLGQVGAEMVAPIAIGLVVDWLLGILPWLTVVGAIVGFVGGICHLVYLNRPGQG